MTLATTDRTARLGKVDSSCERPFYPAGGSIDGSGEYMFQVADLVEVLLTTNNCLTWSRGNMTVPGRSRVLRVPDPVVEGLSQEDLGCGPIQLRLQERPCVITAVEELLLILHCGKPMRRNGPNS